MATRITRLGIVLAALGLAFVAAGGYAFFKAQEGANSLQAFSAAQDIKLAYNDQGQLVDRGETAPAQEILSLLKNDWGYPVSTAELNPNDPLVNTASEYMYQMATIAYHTLHSTQTIVLTEDKEFNGQVFKAGEYQFPIEGRYWSDFNRQHPIEGPARDKAWTGTAHALIANLGVGTVTASALQLGLGLAGLFAGVGFSLVFAGVGLAWAVRPERAPVIVTRRAPVAI